MKSVKVYGFAKVNLFLDVVGEKDGYHMLDTVVVTIDMKDKITLTKRADDKVTIRQSHGLYSVELDADDNNAIKAAKLFMQTYQTSGVDIVLKKNIPIGSGLGGSSADISAVLSGMKKLFDIDDDVKPLADKLGSDSGYLLSGGYARLTGRGENVENLDIKTKLNMVIITASGGVNTAKCFQVYDTISQEKLQETTANRLIGGLKSNVLRGEDFYNALYLPATMVNPEIKNALEDMRALSPSAVGMSGSGSSVFAIFDSVELCEWAKQKLRKKYPQVIVTESLTREELQKAPVNSRSLYSIN